MKKRLVLTELYYQFEREIKEIFFMLVVGCILCLILVNVLI